MASFKNFISSALFDDFLKNYKENLPFFIPNVENSLEDFLKIPELTSLESFCDFWKGPVDVYRPGIADEVNSMEVSSLEALDHYSKGMSLLFNDINQIIPTLDQSLNELRRDLGLSTMTYGRNLIYATPKGRGTDTHFDQNINFVIQLKGEKKWWVAPNKHVENPLTRHTLGTEMDFELQSYTNSMPEKMPDDAREFLLTPGSVLFVPRGAWHRTEALSDSLALNFTYSAPTWIDILTAALRARLAQSSHWRKTADFVTDPKFFGEAEKEFDQLILSLQEDSSHWNARDILSATEMGNFPPQN